MAIDKLKNKLKSVQPGTWKKAGIAGGAVCLCALLAVLLFLFLGGDTRVVLTTGLKKNEIFKIGSQSCTQAEAMIYLTNMQNQYEAVYGAEIWNAKKDGASLEQEAKQQVLSELAQIKAMVLLAEQKGISLEQKEEDRAAAAGKEYFHSLNETERTCLNADEKTVIQMYREYALAAKVYQSIVEDVNPEISDDEARTITVLQIRLDTMEEAEEVLVKAQEENADFEALAESYSRDATVRYSFGKGEAPEAIENAAFDLGKDEISGVIPCGDSWYILKCTSTFDEAQTQVNKVKILEKRRNEAFHTEYNAFVNSLTRQLNEELWESITFIQDEAVTTNSFFTVYQTYFHVE